jgi:hypothetical protein
MGSEHEVLILAALATLNMDNYALAVDVTRLKSEYTDVLEAQNLLRIRGAQNALVSEDAPRWSMTGTSLFLA